MEETNQSTTVWKPMSVLAFPTRLEINSIWTWVTTPSASELGLLMDLSSTKQRHILFYRSKDDGPFVGHESGHAPPLRPGKPIPPDRSPLVTDLTGYERSGQGFATQNFSVRVTGGQRDRSHYPRLLQREWESGILQYCWWAGVDGRAWEIGQEWQGGTWKTKRGLFTAWKYAVFPRQFKPLKEQTSKKVSYEMDWCV